LLEDEEEGRGDLAAGLLSGDTILDLQFKSTILFFVYMGGVIEFFFRK